MNGHRLYYNIHTTFFHIQWTSARDNYIPNSRKSAISRSIVVELKIDKKIKEAFIFIEKQWF